MKTFVDIGNWNRKEHFLFFKDFDDPFFGVTMNVDFTRVYEQAKRDKSSFFLYSQHKILEAARVVKEFCYRIESDNVACYDCVHSAPTIARDDGTFGFGLLEYKENLQDFVVSAKKEIDVVRALSGLCLSRTANRTDLILTSCAPWIAFTDIKHVTNFKKGESMPRITTGKIIEVSGKKLMPLSITANHALMDGIHVANFIQKIEEA